MKQIGCDIYETFMSVYHRVYEREKEMLLRSDFPDVTYNDMQIIMAVGIGEPHNMSMIAKSRSVTVGSLTTAMNGLVRKGYVSRIRGAEDRRVIYIRLTEKGEAVYRAGRQYHEETMERVMSRFSEEEAAVLLQLLSRAQSALDPAEN